LTRDTALASASRRTRISILTAALLLTGLAWGYVSWLALNMATPAALTMPDMHGMDMTVTGMMAPASVPWTSVHFLFIFTMWVVMMVGMMTPSVTPMVLIYSRVVPQNMVARRLMSSAGWFALGYLVAWSLFSVLAALAQWALEALALITPMMAAANHKLGGAVLIAAGTYQWLPIKEVCLSYCRAPLAFVQRHGGFQASAVGSVRLGFLHGKYCVGCCWALMAVLFVVGVMNLLWVAALMIIVLLEKVIPGGRYFSRIVGCAAVAIGIWMIAA
jgi:predicted metal-binding membrane protein